MIDVTKSKTVFHNLLTDIAMHCTSLKECVLQDAYSEESILALLARNSNLRRLSICGKSLSVQKLVRFAPCLIDLNVDGTTCEKELDLLIEFLSQNMRRLCLSAVQCNNSTCFDRLFVRCPHLHTLQLGSLHRDAVNALTPGIAPQLLKFHANLSSVDETSIVKLSQAMPNLQTLILLQGHQFSINNHNDTDSSNSDSSSDISVDRHSYVHEAKSLVLTQALAESTLTHFVNLRQLVTNVHCVGMLHPHPLPTLPCHTTSRKAKLLQEIYIAVGSNELNCTRLFKHCTALTSVGFDTIPRRGSNDLTSNIYACVHANVTKFVLTSAVRTLHCNALAHLSGLCQLVLLQCTDVDEQALRALAHNNPNLYVLHLGNIASAVSEDCLSVFLDSCPCLHSVVFNYVVVSSCTIGSYRQASKERRGGVMFANMIRRLYPNVKQFKSNIFA